MPDREQVAILKQGSYFWARWRSNNEDSEINLANANFDGANLSHVFLKKVDLQGASFIRTRLYGANFSQANLSGANLSGANLHAANMLEANLRSVDFKKADLSKAVLFNTNLARSDLRKATLEDADLSNADLTEAYLERAQIINTELYGATFNGVTLGNTIIAKTNLANVYGLENITHLSPSVVSFDTIQYSRGELPEIFLRGCGLSDWEIESAKLYKPGLSNQEINNIIYKIFDLRASQSIQISPLFISYSHADTLFVEKLEPHLTKKGVRFWRDIHNATSGRLEKQIDRAMRQNPTVLLILSENSISSDWVEHEARLARDLEKEMGRDMLCPIALDDSWKSAKWPARLMEQIMEYNILDYSYWHDDTAFGQVFNKMIAGLDMFYKSGEESSK